MLARGVQSSHSNSLMPVHVWTVWCRQSAVNMLSNIKSFQVQVLPCLPFSLFPTLVGEWEFYPCIMALSNMSRKSTASSALVTFIMWNLFPHILGCKYWSRNRYRSKKKWAKTPTFIQSCSWASQSYIPTNKSDRYSSREGSYILSPSHWNTAPGLSVAVETVWKGGWAGWVGASPW